MRIFKKSAIFLCLNLIVSWFAQFVMVGQSDLPSKFQEFETGGYDSAIIGASFAASGLDPRELEYGSKVFNMAIGGEPFHNLFFILKTLNEETPLKRVYLDMYYPFWTDARYDDNHATLNYQLMEILSKADSWKLFYEDMLIDDYNNIFFPYRLTSTVFKAMPDIVKKKLETAGLKKSVGMEKPTVNLNFQGFTYLEEQNPVPHVFRQFHTAEISERAITDFEKIVQYCDENSIELICVQSALQPIRLLNENHNVDHDFFTELCKTHNVAFYDMNYIKFELFPRVHDDYVDIDGHMLGKTAQRQSALLKEIMTSDNPDEFFEKNYEDVLLGIKVYNETIGIDDVD